MDVYFCDPYSPWQRGTNENTNGLLRQFFPKKSSFASVTEFKLQYVVNLINNRHRKRLGFRTPYEILLKRCT
jgi:IS30 family transposase